MRQLILFLFPILSHSGHRLFKILSIGRAAQERRTLSALVREAVDAYLKKTEKRLESLGMICVVSQGEAGPTGSSWIRASGRYRIFGKEAFVQV